MKIAVITYIVQHQKTQDLVSGLLMYNYKDLTILALPFKERPLRTVKYQHRFTNPFPLNTKTLAQNLGFEYLEITEENLDSYFTKHSFDAILIAGAGLLPESLTKNHRIINSHPGFLPKVKGLDALKWAILNEVPEIGVTTHFISEKADEGILIEREIVPLFKEDSFHSFAQKQYQLEIKMLINAISLQEKALRSPIYLSDDKFKATMRMPIRLEEDMMQKFEERRLNSPTMYD